VDVSDVRVTNEQDCEQAAKTAFGVTLSEQRSEWKMVVFLENGIDQARSNFLPYIFQLFLILAIPIPDPWVEKGRLDVTEFD
jgi:hypothetical protein